GPPTVGVMPGAVVLSCSTALPSPTQRLGSFFVLTKQLLFGPGRCPRDFIRCVEECEADWQCPRGQSCTHTGCGHICMDSHVGGVCPVPRGCGMCLDICSLDKECPWGYKCCSNGCGHVCMRVPSGKGAGAVPHLFGHISSHPGHA
uniref:WAP domain-containing protein n=1 Tax=Falco tinnunculus TaxID=100819 RepID=A0A8C4XJK6_FALTI